MNRCFYCKGIMENGLSNYMTEINGQFIIIKNVPCHKCRQCGEVSYSGKTVAHIEKIIENLKKSFAEVSIVEYAA